jgi:hypothetical protein
MIQATRQLMVRSSSSSSSDSVFRVTVGAGQPGDERGHSLGDEGGRGDGQEGPLR